MIEKMLNVYFNLVASCDIDLWPSEPKMYTALLQVIFYQTMTATSQTAGGGKEIKLKRNKKQKTTQQQKGLPTLSAAFSYDVQSISQC